jgi:uncharacterized protein (DUF433 family)
MSTLLRSNPSPRRKSVKKQPGRAKPSFKLQLSAEDLALDNATSRAAARSLASRRKVVVSNPEIMGGEPCFAGTRVPVRALLDYLEGGDTLDAFLEQYPTVPRKRAVAFLERASERLVGPV